MTILCPCGTGKAYNTCCKIYHEGLNPENALQLMRSRYSAYANSKAAYIIRTTHPDNPDYRYDFSQWTQDILDFCHHTKFQKLEIVDFNDGIDKAHVTFKAHLLQNGVKTILFEKSYFEKLDGKWLYKDAVFLK